MKLQLLILLSLFLYLSCNSDKKVDSKAVKDEIKNRKLLKLSEAEIMQRGLEIGDSIALKSQQTLGKNLQDALMAGGVQNAISFCNLAAMPLVDSLSRTYQATIRRVSTKSRNPQDSPAGIELEILEAYATQWGDSIPLKSNIQILKNGDYLYAKPIFVDNGLCLTCHGTPENGLTAETDAFIKSTYPEDKATGYQIGDLRGMWSIAFPKKVIVQTFQ